MTDSTPASASALRREALRLTDNDQERAGRFVRAFEYDPPRMMRALLRVTRHDRWPWKMRKRWFDLIRQMEREACVASQETGSLEEVSDAH